MNPQSPDPLEAWIRQRREEPPPVPDSLLDEILKQIRPPVKSGWAPMLLWLGKMSAVIVGVGLIPIRFYLLLVFMFSI